MQFDHIIKVSGYVGSTLAFCLGENKKQSILTLDLEVAMMYL